MCSRLVTLGRKEGYDGEREGVTDGLYIEKERGKC